MTRSRRVRRKTRKTRMSLVRACVLLVSIATVSVSAGSEDQKTPVSATVPVRPEVLINRTVPRVSAPSSGPLFSAQPTDDELRRARVFSEPLVLIGRSSAAENQALAAGVTRYVEGGQALGIEPFGEFLAQHPASGWRASVLANLGALHRRAGYYLRALKAWEEAWTLTKDDASPNGRAIADLAVGNALDMLSLMGHRPGLDTWLARANARPMSGPAAMRAERAREARRFIETRPDLVIASGPKALEMLLDWQKRPPSPTGSMPRDRSPERSPYERRLAPAALQQYRPTATGTSLAEVQALATEVGLSMKTVRREGAGALITPAVVHLTIDHYSAVLQEVNGRFLVRDPALGGEVWMPREALEELMSGYALVPASAETAGWRDVAAAEASGVFGHSCPAGQPDPDECVCKESEPGMPVYSLHPTQAGVLLSDAPLGYRPPRGPSVHLQLRYNSWEENQPQVFSFSNLGAKWTSNWMSYLEEVPFTWFFQGTQLEFGRPAHIAVHVPQGGVERFQYEGAGGVFERHYRSAAVLVRTSSSPLTFERRHTDGSKEVYGLPDGGTAGSRRVFLTAIVDPHGQALTLTWDAQFRLVALTDALGQVTTLQYEDADPLKVTSVADPFGRIARMTYDAAGHLASVTDVINLTSGFVYDTQDFIAAMQTPYGVTTFRKPNVAGQNDRAIEAIDPLGAVERLEFHWTDGPVPASAPASDVPSGFEDRNSELNTVMSLHWAKGRDTNNVQEAVASRWLLRSMNFSLDPGWTVSVPMTVQKPLEARTWYDYVGSTARPSRVARKLPDGTTFNALATYNYQDNATSTTDPVGRTMTYTYAANGIDLLEVRNTTGGRNDLLAAYSNYTTGHLPRTMVDAAGQSTLMTYNPGGQILTVTNAKSETTTYGYDPNGYLQTVTGPATGATTTYTYDAYGRVQSVMATDEAAVTMTYDALNRPTRTDFPDGTSEQNTYDKLDLATRRDRKGRLTHFTTNANRQLIAARDPAGRVTQQRWCGCGSLEALIDANGNETRWERDAGGRVLREIRADGVTDTDYTYDLLGRLRTITDPKQQVTTYAYNLDGSLASVVYTNAQIATPSVNWTYDPAYPRLAAMLDGTGTTSYTYQPAGQLGAGQLATVDGPLPNDVISYAYDQLGRVVTRAINGVPLTLAYDALGRVEREVNALGTFDYTFDGVSGRLATVTYPNNQTSTYSYFPVTQNHRLQAIHHRYPSGATLSRFDYTYDAVGNIVTWRQQADTTAVIWEYGYDHADQLVPAVKRATDPQNTILQRFAYGYDPVGNRLFEQIDDNVTTWTYDKLNRLGAQQAGGVLRVAGMVNEPATVRIDGRPATVDGAGIFAGGIQAVPGTSQFTVTATDPSGNAASRSFEIDQSGAPKTFTSDENGNLISDGTRSFEWDARNQLVAVNVGAHRSEFSYDGTRRRVRIVEKESGVTQSDTRIVWCEDQICEERAADGATVTRRAFGAGEQVAGSNRFFAADHLGSVTEITDGSAAVLARYAFDSWGNRTLTGGTDVSNVGYTGHRWQSSGGGWLTQYRLLDPATARWTSEDPLGLTDSVNFYAYVGNRPLTFIDPDGQSAAAAVMGGARGGAAVGGIMGGPAGAVIGGVIGGVIVGGAAVYITWPRPEPAKTTPTTQVPKGPPAECEPPPENPCVLAVLCLKAAKGVMAKARCVPLLLACAGSGFK